MLRKFLRSRGCEGVHCADFDSAGSGGGFARAFPNTAPSLLQQRVFLRRLLMLPPPHSRRNDPRNPLIRLSRRAPDNYLHWILRFPPGHEILRQFLAPKWQGTKLLLMSRERPFPPPPYHSTGFTVHSSSTSDECSSNYCIIVSERSSGLIFIAEVRKELVTLKNCVLS